MDLKIILKICENIPCWYSMSSIWTFHNVENKHHVYKGENCMKRFCSSIREHAMKIINFKKKKAIPLIYKQLESFEKAKIYYNLIKRF